MSNVVPLKPKDNDPVFLLCSCTESSVPLIQCIFVNGKPLITGIVCQECEKFSAVENGFVEIH